MCATCFNVQVLLSFFLLPECRSYTIPRMRHLCPTEQANFGRNAADLYSGDARSNLGRDSSYIAKFLWFFTVSRSTLYWTATAEGLPLSSSLAAVIQVAYSTLQL